MFFICLLLYINQVIVARVLLGLVIYVLINIIYTDSWAVEFLGGKKMALGFSSCSFLTHSVKNPLIFPKKNTNSDLNFMYSIFPAAISTSKNFTHCQCATTQGGEELFLVNSSNTPDVDYLGESTKGDLYLNMGTFVFLKVCIFCNLFSF